MTGSRIFPDWNELNTLKTPLTKGEMTLAKYLDEHLPLSWEIYIQPYLNGDRPDIVILNPNVGMGFFEVKDWNPKYYLKENDDLFVKGSSGKHPIPSPHSQVNRYRDNLIRLYLPFIGEEVNRNRKTLAAFKTFIYFHKMATKQVKQLLPQKNGYVQVFGNDWLDGENIEKIVPDKDRDYSLVFMDDWVDYIRFWLKPPFHHYEEGKYLKLTPEQERHINPAPGQHQRLRGVAGSGKTLVVAHRAAGLASQGKKVLIVTFNITLWHYIRDMISLIRTDFSWEQLEFTHFHGLCKNFLSENDKTWPDDLDSTPNFIIECLQSGINDRNRSYDAILIDEGQDFEKAWYLMLCELLSSNDEVLFVTDARQNIYLRDQEWINSMTGTKFRGRWRELNKSFRLPNPVVEKANHFAELFLQENEPQPIPSEDQNQFPELDPLLIWQNVATFDDCVEKAKKIYYYLTKDKSIHPQNIIYLIPTHEEGWGLEKTFREHMNLKINHVFEDEKKNHYHKKSFWMKDPRLKMSTIHSFKGWEINNVILITPEYQSSFIGSLDNIIYTAITRAKQNLIVLNRNPKYVDYGNTWQNDWNNN